MGRGLPPQVAEDVVFASWEKSTAGFDPRRGSFEAYMQKVVRTACAQWWRRQGTERRAQAALRLLPTAASTAAAERAAQHQQALLDALSDEERQVFAAWALQKHLGKGRVTAAEVGASLGMEPTAYDNAKRRLKARLRTLLDTLGWSVGDVLYGGRDADRAS